MTPERAIKSIESLKKEGFISEEEYVWLKQAHKMGFIEKVYSGSDDDDPQEATYFGIQFLFKPFEVKIHY